MLANEENELLSERCWVKAFAGLEANLLQLRNYWLIGDMGRISVRSSAA